MECIEWLPDYTPARGEQADEFSKEKVECKEKVEESVMRKNTGRGTGAEEAAKAKKDEQVVGSVTLEEYEKEHPERARGGKTTAAYKKRGDAIELAILVREMREAADFTQGELAGLIGTTQSVIARLENVEYSGHSLPMLQKIAVACKLKMELTVRGSRPKFKRGVELS